MASANISNRIDTVKGSFTVARTKTADGEVSRDPSIPAARAGTLTTRTSDSVGTITLSPGHGIVDTNRLDIYWTNPNGTKGFRYGAVVGVVAGNDVPITGGAGDVLPADETAVTVNVPNLETFPIDNGAMVSLIVGSEQPAIAVFIDGAAAVLLAVTIDSNQDSYVWDDANGLANPFAADSVSVYLSHGFAGAAARVTALALVN